MGRLELELPEIGISLEDSAKELEDRIRRLVPEKSRGSIAVRPLRGPGRTGLEISYDDEVENLVYAAIEYPKESRREGTVGP